MKLEKTDKAAWAAEYNIRRPFHEPQEFNLGDGDLRAHTRTANSERGYNNVIDIPPL